MNLFENVEALPPDAILGLNLAFAADPRETKVNLGVGAYKTTDLKPFILTTVKKAEHLLLEKEQSKDYLPIDGLKEYIDSTKKLVFGESRELGHIYGAQTVGGTAALRIGAAFLKELGLSKIYISDPTWANHRRIFQHAALDVHTYPYFDRAKRKLDFEGVIKVLEKIEEKSIFVLQASCHNPSGFDFSIEQWKQVSEMLIKNEVFPFFDFAYQGFGEGIEEDAASIRLVLDKGIPFAVALSHAKNFGLYAERAGALYIVCEDLKQVEKIGSQIKMIIRGLYSNPPLHGAHIVSTILQDPELKKQWIKELQMMQERIAQMRKALCTELHVKTTSDVYDSLSEQKGMFSYTGLDKNQVEQLISDFAIYLPQDGRINVAGLNTENLGYVAEAIIAVTK